MYQPDIPQNCGAMMRLCACIGVGLEIIEPCGFIWDERKIRTSAMDYYDKAAITRHSSWEAFYEHYQGTARIILMSTKASQPYCDFSFESGDILLAGRESAGVPIHVHESADARVFIQMKQGLRSLNIVNATSMIVGEALRQTTLF
jgi:tRNA (cytidine/uridine-2'-O-)-methyltransferase